MIFARGSMGRLKQFNVDRAFLPLRTHLHLERDSLRCLWTSTQTAERLDMDENFFPALHGLNEAKASVIVPGFNDAFKSHNFSYCLT